MLLKDDNVAGYFVTSSVAGEVILMNIAVVPARQGIGYGRKLLQFLLDYSKQKNEQEIWLEVRASNKAALALYKRLGFAVLELLPL